MKNLQSILPQLRKKLPVVNLVNFNKKQYLKQLQLSDIITVMVQQQKSIDRTLQLKSYLTKNYSYFMNNNNQNIQDENINKSLLEGLPEFAIKQYKNNKDLLEYLLNRKNINTFQQIKKWGHKLQSIQKQFNCSLQKYQYEIQQGNKSLQEVKEKVNQVYNKVIKIRQQYKQININKQKYSRRVIKNIRKLQNIKRTILMAKNWNKSNISKILSQKVENIHNMDIKQQMQQIQNCIQFLRRSSNNIQFQNIQKVLKIIQSKKTLMIQKVQKNLSNSIIDFNNIKQYELKYEQYNQLLKYLTRNDQNKMKEYHQLEKYNLEIMIQENTDEIYLRAVGNVLKKVKLNNNSTTKILQSRSSKNIQSLSQLQYIEFTNKLHQQFSLYFHHWHLVTSYHMQHMTVYKQNFISSLNIISEIFLKKLYHFLKYSQRFSTLKLVNKIKFIVQINKIVDLLQQWTGKKDKSLFVVIKDRLKSQIQIKKKQINGKLKEFFIEEFKEDKIIINTNKIIKENSKNQFIIEQNNVQNKKDLLQLNQLIKDENINKIIKQKMFNITSTNNNQTPITTPQQLVLIIPSNSPIGQLLTQSLIIYSLYHKIFPFNPIQLILQHIQFIIILIYKSCIFEQTKNKFIQSCFNFNSIQNQSNNKYYKQIQIGIEKNPFDQNIIQNISKLRELYLYRKNYYQLQIFIRTIIKNKYDTLIVNNIANINKLYNNSNNNIQGEQNLNRFHLKLIKLVEEVYMLIKWLTKNYQMFYVEKYDEKSQQNSNSSSNKNMNNSPNNNNNNYSPNNNNKNNSPNIYNNNNNQSINSENSSPFKPFKYIKDKQIQTHKNNNNIIRSKSPEFKLQLYPHTLLQLAFLHFEYQNQITCYKYLQLVQPIIKPLKWRIQKFNSQITLQFKQYKLKILQIFRSSFNVYNQIKNKQIYQQFMMKKIEILYKALLYIYCKIQKINDNGRQLIRLDIIQINKILVQFGYKPGSWANWFEKYVEIAIERTSKNAINKIQCLGIVYPLFCWKANLMWIMNDLSVKQKKQYFINILKIYINQIKTPILM